MRDFLVLSWKMEHCEMELEHAYSRRDVKTKFHYNGFMSPSELTLPQPVGIQSITTVPRQIDSIENL